MLSSQESIVFAVDVSRRAQSAAKLSPTSMEWRNGTSGSAGWS